MKKVKTFQDAFHCPICREELDAVECLIVSDTGKCTECCIKLVRDKARKKIQSESCPDCGCRDIRKDYCFKCGYKKEREK